MGADRTSWRRCQLVVLTLLGALLLMCPGAAFAQGSIPAPENYQAIDANGVNVSTGAFQGPTHSISIGQPGAGGLSLNLYYDTTTGSVKWRHDLVGALDKNPIVGEGADYPQYILSVMGMSATFMRATTGEFILIDGTGTLTFDDADTYTYTALDGTVVSIDRTLRSMSPFKAWFGQARTITRPNGEVITFHYKQVATGGGGGAPAFAERVQSVTNNFGHQVHFRYASDAYGDAWTDLIEITALNRGIDWCDPIQNTCTFSRDWPSLTIGGTSTDRTITDATGGVTHYLFPTANSRVEDIRTPRYTTGANVHVTYHSTPVENVGKVASVRVGSDTWTYGYSIPYIPPYAVSYEVTGTVTDPLDNATSLTSLSVREDPWGRYTTRLISVEDALGNETQYGWGGPGYQLSDVIYPEGNKDHFDYNGAGALAGRVRFAKGSPPTFYSNITAAFDDCDTPAVCNKPTSITDDRGNTTNYVYDDTTGQLVSETAPAPTTGATRPQTRYTYQNLSAWYRTSSSVTKVQGPAISMLTQVSSCSSGTAPSCVGTAHEVKTTTTYQTGNASTYSNLQPVTVSIGAGNALLAAIATTTTTYDANGDVKTVNGPLSGTADTTWYAYDLMRRALGSIGPDPDGAGSLARPMRKTVYFPDGLVDSTEVGTAPSQNDAGWAAFSRLEFTVSAYDKAGRKTRDTYYMGSGRDRVTDYEYDAAGRLLCTALRMNPAVYTTLPDSACERSTGSINGPDRIVRNTYDPVGRLTQVQSGYDTPWVQNTRLQAYTTNGQVDWVEDANGNRSDYTYDGLDRLIKLNFPSPTLGSHTSSATDYESYGYDQGDNLISKRVRSGETLTYAYDALNRETVITAPGGGTANDVFSTYDSLGRRLSARFDSITSANAVIWTWDALGRPLTETTYGRTLTSEYDLAGRRTKLTWPTVSGATSLFVDYTWDLADRLDQVRENGATSGLGLIADFTYDNLGRRTGLARGNGANTSWTYVANSLDWGMTHNLSGTTNDVGWSFVINPAGQIRQKTLSNALYDWGMTAGPVTAYQPDGLNRYTTVGGTTFQYNDERGNLTDDGPRGYVYDLANRLIQITGGSTMTLSYDPLGRLRRYVSPAETVEFLWDGDQIRAEFNGSTGAVTARHVHSDRMDEALVWYNGSVLWDRRWEHLDHQNSLIALSVSTGALTGARYSYSPYGEPDPWNQYGASYARFRYTGQISLRHAPLWHYKARVYSPGIGRFLQTDPVGYVDSLNLYQYALNDPVNLSDPTGMQVGAAGYHEYRALTRNGPPQAPLCSSPGRCGSPDMFLDFIPVVGDIKGALEFFSDPSWGGAAVLAIGLIPGGDIVKYGDEAFSLLSDGMRMNTDDALETSLAVLGDGYSEVASGVFRSSDGQFQVRMTDSDLAGRGTGGEPHINIEKGNTRVDQRTGRLVFEQEENIHLILND